MHKILLFMAGLVLSAPFVQADDNLFKMTATYIGIAESMFEKDHKDLLANFVNVKGTPDGSSNVIVKVTLVNGQSFSYFCMLMPDPMCHAQ